MSKLSEKQLLLLSIGVSAILLIGGLVLCFFEFRKINAAKDRIKQQKDTIAGLDTKIASIPKLKDEKNNLLQEIEIQERILPSAKDLEMLNVSVVEIAEKSNVDLANFSPQGNEEGENYERIGYATSLTGKYWNIADFIYKLEKFRRFIAVDRFSVSGITEVHQSSLTMSTYTFTGDVLEYEEVDEE